jgi:polyisoprenoid-binding protein YceI
MWITMDCYVSIIVTSLSTVALVVDQSLKASAAFFIIASFSRITLIASVSKRSGGYGPSDSTLTVRNVERRG